MITVGITGNMGSGKTLVCSLFEHLKVPVFYADREAKALYSKPDIFEKVKNYFGKSVYDKQKKIIPTVLAKKIFNKPEALSFVNQIIHPAVQLRFQEWMKVNASSKYCIYEAAILFETGRAAEFDQIIFVSSPEFLRIERILIRDKTTLKAIKSRLEQQWPEEKKLPLSHFIIVNDGKQMLLPQVLKIHQALIAASVE